MPKPGSITVARIRRAKRQVIGRLQRLVDPYLWKSGFVKSNVGERPKIYTRLYWFAKPRVISGISPSHLDNEGQMFGFTDQGVIDNDYYMLTYVTWGYFSLEELLLIERWLKRHGLPRPCDNGVFPDDKTGKLKLQGS